MQERLCLKILGAISHVTKRKLTQLIIIEYHHCLTKTSKLSFTQTKQNKTYPMFHRAYFYKCRYHIYGGEKKDKFCRIFVYSLHFFFGVLFVQIKMEEIMSSQLEYCMTSPKGKADCTYSQFYLQISRIPSSKKTENSIKLSHCFQ